MLKVLIVTHVVYLTLLILTALYFKDQIMLAYVRREMTASSHSVELPRDVVIVDKSNREIGRLSRGVKLMSPSVEDVSDTDISDNMRFKLLVDIDIKPFAFSKSNNDKSIEVYRIEEASR